MHPAGRNTRRPVLPIPAVLRDPLRFQYPRGSIFGWETAAAPPSLPPCRGAYAGSFRSHAGASLPRGLAEFCFYKYRKCLQRAVPRPVPAKVILCPRSASLHRSSCATVPPGLIFLRRSFRKTEQPLPDHPPTRHGRSLFYAGEAGSLS